MKEVNCLGVVGGAMQEIVEPEAVVITYYIQDLSLDRALKYSQCWIVLCKPS